MLKMTDAREVVGGLVANHTTAELEAALRAAKALTNEGNLPPAGTPAPEPQRHPFTSAADAREAEQERDGRTVLEAMYEKGIIQRPVEEGSL